MHSDEKKTMRQQSEFLSGLERAETERRVRAVRDFARDGMPVREVAEVLGINKETVVKYRRLAGLTPPPPLKHLGGGRWVKADEDDDRDPPSRPFKRGR